MHVQALLNRLDPDLDAEATDNGEIRAATEGV
jgi:hypothetical protein